MTTEPWYGCYVGTRKDLFTPESNRHPAKMAVRLCFRIFEHGERMGYWKKGDLILDPMAGIGTTLVVGAVLGYRTVGVELESHFVDLAEQNIWELFHKHPYTFSLSEHPRVIQGEQQTIFGKPERIRRERKSFFKRLFERKYPHLRVDHEDVLWFRRSNEAKST